MLSDLFLALYIGCAGFVAAGVIGSAYQYLTNQPPRFNVAVEGVAGIVGYTGFCLFAGPFIIMRNAIRGRRIENRPLGWFVASSTIAGMWSLGSGLLLIQLILIVMGRY